MYYETEEPGYKRDGRSTALLNTDRAAYERFLLDRKQALQAQQLQEQVTNIQQEFAEIKQLLQQLVREK